MNKYFRFSVVLIAIIAVLVSVFGCAAQKTTGGTTEATTPENTTPEITTEGKTDPPSSSPLSNEDKQKFIDYRKEKAGAELTVDKFDSVYKYYGEYSGNHVFFTTIEKSGVMTLPNDVYTIFSIDVNDVHFFHPRSFSIIVYNGSEAPNINEAFEKGYVSESDVQALAELHNSEVSPYYHNYYVEFEKDQAPGEMSEEKLAEFKAVADKIYSENGKINVDLVHYGTYGDKAVFFMTRNAKNDVNAKPITYYFDSCGEIIQYYDYFHLVVYKYGGGFFSMSPMAISQRSLLTADEIADICAYHNTRLPDSLKRTYFDIPDDADPDSISEDTLNSMLDAYNNRPYGFDSDPDPVFDTIKHYGSYGGYTFLRLCNTEDKTASSFPLNSSIKVEMDVKFRIVVYHNGLFHSSLDAFGFYDYITEDILQDVADHHNNILGR